MYRLQTAKQYYKKGLIPITINFRNLRQNRQYKDLFKDRFKIGNIKIFLKIDLKQVYYQIRIKKGNK